MSCWDRFVNKTAEQGDRRLGEINGGGIELPELIPYIKGAVWEL